MNSVKSDKYTLSKFQLKSHSQHTIRTKTFNIDRIIFLTTDSERHATRLHVVPVIALTFNSLSLMDPVLIM